MSDVNLRGLCEDGFLRLVIKAKDTENNELVHESFRDFAQAECGNDYTLALNVLLRYFADRGLFESVNQKVLELEARISSLESNGVPKKNEVF